MSENELHEHIKSQIPMISQWISNHVFGSSVFSGTNRLHVNQIVDIELPLWSKNLGLKGKIDAVLNVNLTHGKNEYSNVNIPYELKTGKKSYFSHHAQLLLYILMMSLDLKETIKSFVPGILHYLGSTKIEIVDTSDALFISLISARNKLSEYTYRLDSFSQSIETEILPEIIRDSNVCSRCYQRELCVIFDQSIENRAHSKNLEVFSEIVSQLTPRMIAYLNEWEQSLIYESQENANYRNEFFQMTAEEREKTGRCIRRLSLSRYVADGELNTENLIYRLYRNDLSIYHVFSEAETVILSIDDSAGASELITPYFVSIRFYSEHEIIVSSKEELPNFFLSDPNAKFRLDKDSHSSFISTMRGNIMKLLLPSNASLPNIQHTKDLILGLRDPKFDLPFYRKTQENPMSIIPSALHSEFLSLNADQRNAILLSLSILNYMLILGMPGTGKSSTIALLIRILVLSGKKVLVASHTNSAVDNIMRKVAQYIDCYKLIRIGSDSSIADDILLNEKILKVTPRTVFSKVSLEGLKNAFSGSFIVGVTCMSVSSSTFSMLFDKENFSFDYCIIDEASQIPEPIVLAPLMLSQRFILVGDPYQLPPIVKNSNSADKLGVSLFRRLCECCPSNLIINLEYQYRMNSEIVSLCNSLIYSHRLKYVSFSTEKRLSPNLENVQFNSVYLSMAISPSPAVLLLDTCECSDCSEELDSNGSFINRFEGSIIFSILESFENRVKDDIAVISAYRGQVDYLRSKISKESTLSVEIDTIDRFQGRDKDVVIFSTVRVEKAGDLLFDWRRINVALTRAKAKLIILLNSKVINGCPILEDLYAICKNNNWVHII
jgi:DNA replication ATP-dependent helicase Dna2